VFDESFQMLCASHEIASLWLIAHEGCSYYRNKHPHADAGELRSIQVRDLSRARTRVRERRPDLDVRLIYTWVEDGRVYFANVGEEELASHGI
jgi:hypothetical protein